MARRLLAALWVAAILDGRRQSRTRSPIPGHWNRVHDLTAALGNPPWPYTGPRSR